MVEFWLHAFPPYDDLVERALRAEADGWTGILLPENQFVTPDPYVVLSRVAAATSTLRLGQGCSNPGTRDASLHASQAISLHWVSGGRALLGLGRGDSAHAFLGLPPMPLADFERYVRTLQRYLAGESVPVAGSPRSIEWLPRSGLPKVPLEISATGPRVIALAAELAERVALNLGASPERIGRAVAGLRGARERVRLDPEGIQVGAYVNVAAHSDIAVAREMVRGGVSGFARFSAMSGRAVDGLTVEDRRVTEAMVAAYDMEGGHGQAMSRQASLLDDSFIDRFAVLGPPQRCVDHLAELVERGVRHLVISPQSRFTEREAVAESIAQIGETVIPALRAL